MTHQNVSGNTATQSVLLKPFDLRIVYFNTRKRDMSNIHLRILIMGLRLRLGIVLELGQ